MSSSLMQFVWPVLLLLLGAMQIATAVILLKERHVGPWLMLAGAIAALLSSLATQVMVYAMNHGYRDSITPMSPIFQAISALGALGWLLFTIGLLLYALRQRGKSNRIAELEMIIATLHSQR